MIRTGAASFRISADVRLSSYTERYDIEQGEKRSLRIAGKNITKSSDFAGSFRTVAFLPDDPLILTGASQMRDAISEMATKVAAGTSAEDAMAACIEVCNNALQGK